MTHWKLEWLTVGEEQEHRDDSVVMAGIGPDGARIMRGQSVMWPYLNDGSFCPLYQKQADILTSPLAKHTLSRFFIRQMIQEVVDRMLRGQAQEPIGSDGFREWVADGYRHINCRCSINPEANPEDPVEHGGECGQ